MKKDNLGNFRDGDLPSGFYTCACRVSTCSEDRGGLPSSGMLSMLRLYRCECVKMRALDARLRCDCGIRDPHQSGPNMRG